MEDRGWKIYNRLPLHDVILDLRFSLSAVGLAYPYARAVVGIFRLSQICRRAKIRT
jgi:hypothetical protein